MHRLGFLFRVVGLALGMAIIAAIGVHWGWPGAPWLINVALAKLGLIGAGGLMGAGAVAERVARREDARRIGALPVAPFVPAGRPVTVTPNDDVPAP